MPRLELTSEEARSIQALGQQLAEQFESTDCEDFLKEVPIVAHRLPERVRRFMNDFRILEPDDAVCLISGYPVDQEKIGPTPQHWKNRPTRPSTLEEDMVFVLVGSLLGDCIGWATQQDSHIVHDIFPIQGNEGEQLGTGSEQLLCWHTEDAFHPFRGDYVGMMCLRNPDAVATTVGTLQNIELPLEQKPMLFEPEYTIRPDESHLKKNQGNGSKSDAEIKAAYERMDGRNTAPEKISVLFGDPESPYLRLDPFFMDEVEDEKAREALNSLTGALDQNMEGVVLKQGDFCFIDNFKAVHGRKPFKARYDGQDRWLKRVLIARDLRKSREARSEAHSHVIV